EAQAPPQVRLVLLGQRGNVDGDAGKVDALVVGHRTTDDDLGRDDGAVGFDDLNLDLAIVDEKEVAGRDVLGQPLEGRSGELLGTDDLFRRDLEDVADG